MSFLQSFHHFGAPWDVYLGIVLKNEGLWIFIFLNAFIHTIMYTYYAISAAGIPYPAKPLITLMQIIQFVGGFTLVWPYINVPCYRQNQGMMISWVFNYWCARGYSWGTFGAPCPFCVPVCYCLLLILWPRARNRRTYAQA